jgi:preprotein translocase subunit SecF
MRLLRLVPNDTRIDFMGLRHVALAFTLILTLASLGSLALQGLSLGIDFAGGILIEARSAQPIDTGNLRNELDRLELGEVVIQTSGGNHSILIRVQKQPGDQAAQTRAITAIRNILGPSYEVRRTEFIGPQISRDLLIDGLLASGLAVILIAIYVWFRFEWQFGVSALITTLHDVLATFGLFSLLHLEFNMTVVAAILTIAGYSINDTVVVFDRIRENLRRHKKTDLRELINLSINQTLSRTVLTSGTTLLAVLSLLFFGGPVLRNFAAALTWGILIGTYSSIFVASVLLLFMPPLRTVQDTNEPADDDPAQPTSADRS